MENNCPLCVRTEEVVFVSDGRIEPFQVCTECADVQTDWYEKKEEKPHPFDQPQSIAN